MTQDAPTTPRGKPLGVGDLAPEFTLPDQTGTPRSLSAIRAGRPAVVYFYPKNNTPVCTAEACAFRDEFDDFRTLDAAVIGISADTPESHAAFAKRFNLPFTLLSDARGQASALFGVPKTLGLFAGRVTYVIDAGGTIRRVINSQLQAAKHVREALESLRSPATPTA